MEYKHVGRLIKTLSNSFEKEFNKIALKHDLTTSQSMVLIYLQKNKDKEISPIDIEKHFNYSHASILGILKRLEEKNFITTRKSSKDKRYKIVEINDKGNNVEKEIKKALIFMVNKLYMDISNDEIETFINILNKMINNLQKENLC